MRYLMLVCVDRAMADELPAEEKATIGPQAEAWAAELDGRGIRSRGHELADVEDATTIRVRGGDVVIADGPFAETKEQIAGFDILECRDLDEAMEVAAKHPVARFGALELRPFTEG
jgi:hypothetical protein